MKNSINQYSWFSMLGIKRGLLVAGLISFVWLAWALGFTQGFSMASQVSSSLEMELKPIQIQK